MKKNMGTVDRTIRILAVFVIAVLLLTGQIQGVLATVLVVISAVFLLTSIVGSCPLYQLLRFSTRKESSGEGR